MTRFNIIKVMNEVKVIIVNVITAVLGFLSPIQDFMTAIVILFSRVGYSTDYGTKTIPADLGVIE